MDVRIHIINDSNGLAGQWEPHQEAVTKTVGGVPKERRGSRTSRRPLRESQVVNVSGQRRSMG